VGICGVQVARLPLLAGSGKAFFFLHLLLRAADLGSKKQIHYFLPTFVRFEHHLHPLLLTEVKIPNVSPSSLPIRYCFGSI
jgi:hypothetical protein